MIRLALTAALLLAVAPRPQQDPPRFEIHRENDTVLVSANSTPVGCDQALDELAKALDWRLRYEPPSLKGELANHHVHLAFENQGPKTLFWLLAAAGGVQAEIYDRSSTHDLVQVIIVPSLEPESPLLQKRLQRRAVQWYRQYLEEAQGGGESAERIADTRFRLATILEDLGAHQDAVATWRRYFTEARDREDIPRALLGITRSLFALGQYDRAEKSASELIRSHPRRPEVAEATILLGRILMAQGRYEQCARDLRASYAQLSQRPELIDVHLLVGLAEFRSRQWEQLDLTVEGVERYREPYPLGPAREQDFLFLHGAAALHRDEASTAIGSLSRWVAGEDSTHELYHTAMVMLGRAHFENGNYVRARVFAIAARRAAVGLDRYWTKQSIELAVDSSLAIGDEDELLNELDEQIGRSGEEVDPQFRLLVARVMLEQDHPDRAIRLVGPLVEASEVHRDEALYIRIEGRFDRARRDDSWQSFLELALPEARRVSNPDVRTKAAQFIAIAYRNVGEPEKAADAILGVFR